MSALKPCPFCGSTNLTAPTRADDYVTCNACRVFGPSADVPERTQSDIRIADAIDRWNTRPGEKA